MAGWPLIRTRVAGTSHDACGVCQQCVEGRYNLCENYGVMDLHRQYGHNYQGADADYVVHGVKCIFPLPDEISWEEGAVIDPACDEAKLRAIRQQRPVDVVINSHNHWYERYHPTACGTAGRPGSDTPCSVGADMFADGTVHMTTGGAGAFTIPGWLCGFERGRARCSGAHHYLLFNITNEELTMEMWRSPHDPAILDTLARVWFWQKNYKEAIKYQALAERIWARRGFYQSSGAFGFRDQLQDVLSLAVTKPDIVREQLLRAAARQFRAGDRLLFVAHAVIPSANCCWSSASSRRGRW